MGYMNQFKIPSANPPPNIRPGAYMIICPAAVDGIGSFPGMQQMSTRTVQQNDDVNDDLTQNWAYFFAHELSHFIIKTKGERKHLEPFCSASRLMCLGTSRLWIRLG